MKLSIVATLYHSSRHVVEFYQRASVSAKKLVGEEYEIVLVNDGSPDNSLELAVQLTEQDKHVIVIDLSRNFGHHKAMMTGLSHARGDLVFLIDSDLEEEPEWLLSFDEQMNREKCDVVFGIQGKRKGGWFERWSGEWFYLTFNLLTRLDLPANIVTARLMIRPYIEALLMHKEREILIAGLWHITGFNQKSQIVKKLSFSKSTYSLHRKITILVNAITSFSNIPLIGIFYIGTVISSIALIYISFLIINWWILSTPLSGWTSLVASIWLLGGMTISFIGVVGIYLAKIFSETKQRPYTIVRKIYGE